MRVLLTCLGCCIAVLVSGCATSGPTHSPEDVADVVGVWKYTTTGSSGLEGGILRITVREGRLRGTIRDRRNGMLSARIRVNGERVDLRIQDLHASGRVDNGTFEAFLRRPLWDVSTSQNVRRRDHTRRPSNSGMFIARRVTSFQDAFDTTPSACTPLLEETDYRCTTSLLP